MTDLRITYEQQLTSLKQEANDVITAVSSLSNRDLLITINYYLHYFNCETWSADEMFNIELQLNADIGTVST
jgi:hypothetical protein